MPRSIRLSVDGTGLEYDADYGVERRSGWCATHEGVVLRPEFTGLPRATWTLIRFLVCEAVAGRDA